MSFVVVEFLQECAVEVVLKSWIFDDANGTTYCYWPTVGASAKVKKQQLPDKEKWATYEIRIFSYAGTYDKALERSKRAEETSNIDSDLEGLKRRPTRKPAKYDFSEEEEADDEDDERCETSHTSTTVAVLPQPPQHNEVNASPNSSRCINKLSLFRQCSTPERLHGSSKDNSPLAQQSTHNRHDRKITGMTASSPTCRDSSPHASTVRSEAELTETRFTAIMARLNAIQDTLERLENRTRSREPQEDIEDVLLGPVSNVAELAELCKKVADKEFKIKLTQYLSALGGHNLGDAVRRIFQKLGTNNVWSSYSLKGRKGKQAFTELPLYRIVIRVCLKSFANSKESEVDNEISEALKHAPKRKGGPRYKDPMPKRRQTCPAQESSDPDDSELQ